MNPVLSQHNIITISVAKNISTITTKSGGDVSLFYLACFVFWWFYIWLAAERKPIRGKIHDVNNAIMPPTSNGKPIIYFCK